MGPSVAATEEEQPSHPSRRCRRLLPAGRLPISLYITAVYVNEYVLILLTGVNN